MRPAIRWSLGLLTATAALAGGAVAEPPAPTLESVMAPLIEEHGVTGAAITLFRDGRRVDTAYFGFADTQSGRAVDAQTVFQAASLTKPLFTLAVLRARSEPGFDLDRPLVKYLDGPYVHVQEPWLPDGEGATDEVVDSRLGELTARFALSHRSGLPNWAHERPLKFNGAPGKKWSYSGEGYVIAQRALEAATGMPLEQWIRRSVFEPFGMQSSHMGWREAIEPRRAHGYRDDGSEHPIAARPEFFLRANAAGSLHTTLDDYAAFLQGWIAAVREGEAQVMVQPLATVDRKLELSWGLGCALAGHAGRDYAFHWGSNPGYQALFVVDLGSGDGFLYLTNSEQGLELKNPVARHVFGIDLPWLGFRMLSPND